MFVFLGQAIENGGENGDAALQKNFSFGELRYIRNGGARSLIRFGTSQL
jgi:hypothetical protein